MLRKMNLAAVVLAMAVCTINAQTAANNWLFGQGAGISFNPTPTATAVNTINTFEGSSSISDSNGNLLFYTDGTTVWNKSNLPMTGGTGLLGNPSSTHSALIVPCHCDKYFIFTTAAAETQYSDGLRYSVVDMTQSAGLGAVTSKNNVLLAKAAEKIAGVSDGSGGFWVVAHTIGDNQFFSYHVLANSDCKLSSQAAGSSAVGSSYSGGSANFGQGQIKISPDGTKLAVAGLDYGATSFIELFNFDKATGKVTNYGVGSTLVRDVNGDMFYGLEFSPNGKKLYVTTIFKNSKIFQYDILASSLSPRTLVKDYGGIASEYHVGQLQLAPDGRIYIARPRRDISTSGALIGQSYLDALTTPDGGTGGFLSPAITLANPSQSRIGLPTVVAGNFSCEPPTESCGVKTNEISCKTDGSGGYLYTFTVTNDTGYVVTDVLLTPKPNSGITITPQQPTLPPGGIAIGASLTLNATISGGKPDEKACFTVTLMTADGECCSTEVCPVLPECCAVARDVSIECNKDGTFTYTLSIVNTGVNLIEHIYLYPPAGVTMTPNYFAASVKPGDTFTTKVTIKGARPGARLCFDISLHTANMESCCKGQLCIVLPDCKLPSVR